MEYKAYAIREALASMCNRWVSPNGEVRHYVKLNAHDVTCATDEESRMLFQANADGLKIWLNYKENTVEYKKSKGRGSKDKNAMCEKIIEFFMTQAEAKSESEIYAPIYRGMWESKFGNK